MRELGEVVGNVIGGGLKALDGMWTLIKGLTALAVFLVLAVAVLLWQPGCGMLVSEKEQARRDQVATPIAPIKERMPDVRIEFLEGPQSLRFQYFAVNADTYEECKATLPISMEYDEGSYKLDMIWDSFADGTLSPTPPGVRDPKPVRRIAIYKWSPKLKPHGTRPGAIGDAPKTSGLSRPFPIYNSWGEGQPMQLGFGYQSGWSRELATQHFRKAKIDAELKWIHDWPERLKLAEKQGVPFNPLAD